MINTAYLNEYRNNEFIQFMADMVHIQIRNKARELDLGNVVALLSKTKDELISLSQVDRKSDLTKDLATIDNARDEDSTGIKYVVRGFTYHFNNDLKAAAKLILYKLDTLAPDLNRLNYQSQTSATTTLIEEWKHDPKLNQAVELLGLSGWFKQLGKNNHQFNQVFLQRIKEEAESPTIKIPQLRKQATMQYRTMVQHIEAHATLSDDKAYDVLIEQMNVLIEKYNALVTEHSAS